MAPVRWPDMAARGDTVRRRRFRCRGCRPAGGGLPPQASEPTRLSLRHDASPLQWPHLDARHVSLTELRGKVVIVNFWASWCLECRPEMPVLEQLHREFASRGLAVIGINAYESKSAVRRYAKELGLTFPLVLDQDRKINAQYGVIGLPTTFVVGRDGYAVAFGIGPREWAGAPARALIGALLAEATSRRDGR